MRRASRLLCQAIRIMATTEAIDHLARSPAQMRAHHPQGSNGSHHRRLHHGNHRFQDLESYRPKESQTLMSNHIATHLPLEYRAMAAMMRLHQQSRKQNRCRSERNLHVHLPGQELREPSVQVNHYAQGKSQHRHILRRRLCKGDCQAIQERGRYLQIRVRTHNRPALCVKGLVLHQCSFHLVHHQRSRLLRQHRRVRELCLNKHKAPQQQRRGVKR